MKQLPFVEAGHRNGAVFLRIVHQMLGWRADTMVRLTPAEAKKIGEELLELAARAQGHHKPLKIKKKA